MAASFPTSLPDGSVGGWLQALNMAKYEPAFAAAGVTTEQALKRMDDGSLKEIGVSMAGHRKRILLGIDSLSSADAGCSTDVDMADAAPVAAAEPQRKVEPRFNSTSSIFISSTITRPDIDEIIFCVAVVIHDRVEQGEQSSQDRRDLFPFFSEENNPLYKDPAERPRADEQKKKKLEVPCEEAIFHTIQSVYECAKFPSECLIISLVYIERLSAKSHVPLLVTSWRPILLAALILAQKVWDDKSLHNADFSLFCPMFTLKEINHLEIKFLELLEHDVSISASLYASYYFQLRTLCNRENREFKLKQLDSAASSGLETRSQAYTSLFKREQKERLSQSANAIPSARSLGSGL